MRIWRNGLILHSLPKVPPSPWAVRRRWTRDRGQHGHAYRFAKVDHDAVKDEIGVVEDFEEGRDALARITRRIRTHAERPADRDSDRARLRVRLLKSILISTAAAISVSVVRRAARSRVVMQIKSGSRRPQIGRGGD